MANCRTKQIQVYILEKVLLWCLIIIIIIIFAFSLNIFDIFQDADYIISK